VVNIEIQSGTIRLRQVEAGKFELLETERYKILDLDCSKLIDLIRVIDKFKEDNTDYKELLNFNKKGGK
jgi:hypothetical protein